MAFSPLQSRLVASVAATIAVVIVYLLLFSPHLALADDVPRSLELSLSLDQPLEEPDFLSPTYDPDFALFDRSIVGRAPDGVTPLHNNVLETLNLEPGTVACYILERPRTRNITSEDDNAESDLEEPSDDPEARRTRRQADTTQTIHITANTCLQPQQTDPDEDDQSPPQLTLLTSISSDDGCPRNTSDLLESQWVPFEEGMATLSIESSDDVYISIMAPNVSSGFDGVYNFELAASTDDYYHRYSRGALGSTDLLWMDSDSSAALLTTRNLTNNANLTEEYMKLDPPYELYIENEKWRVFNGVRRSVCAMKKVALIEANKADTGRLHELVRTALTTRGPGGLPKQQFYFEGLNSTSTYNAILVRPMNTSNEISRRQEDGSEEGEVGGGGTVFEGIEFRTLTGTTCKVVTDLEFCSEVQYAVPGSDRFNGTELARVYDNYARTMYSNFEKVMMQIACEADSSSKYSLVRDCDDCKSAYKRWLCTVAIPRCEDYTSETSSGIIRSAGQPFPNGTKLPEDVIAELSKSLYHNVSRNHFIDEEIAPGPYKEILPCEDLCYEVVQSCPASIGFACPRPWNTGFNTSYGQRSEDVSVVACNYPGEPRTRYSAATSILPQRLLLGAIPIVVVGFLLI